MNRLMQNPEIEVLTVKVVHSKKGKLINVTYSDNGNLFETFYETSA